MTEQERFERYQAAKIGMDYKEIKCNLDEHERIVGERYGKKGQFAKEWEIWQAATAQAVPINNAKLMLETLKHLVAVMANHDKTPEEFNTLCEADECIKKVELQVVPQGEMFYALKDEYFEGQYFELGCVIENFESDYGCGDILEVLCAEITTVKHPSKFITTLGHGKTQLFDTSEEAKQAIKAAQEGE